MNGACHCGAVTIRVPGRPEYLNRCNCTLCTKIGGLWAYYPRSKVVIDGDPRAYVRSDMADPYLSSNFCDRCGATTHWMPLAADAPDRMGVNMRLFDEAELVGLEVRYGNRRDDRDDAPRTYCEPTVFGRGHTEP